jgi:hypothetical protein
MPGERAPTQYPLKRRLGGLKSWSGRYEKDNFLTLVGLNSGSFVAWLVVSQYTDCATLALYGNICINPPLIEFLKDYL